MDEPELLPDAPIPALGREGLGLTIQKSRVNRQPRAQLELFPLVGANKPDASRIDVECVCLRPMDRPMINKNLFQKALEEVFVVLGRIELPTHGFSVHCSTI